MNKTDAVKILQKYVFDDEECIAQDMKDYNEALKMAIEALSAGPNCKDCKKRNNTTFFMDDEEALDVDAREVHNYFESISTPIYDYMVGKRR